eukprot:g18457.t1
MRIVQLLQLTVLGALGIFANGAAGRLKKHGKRKTLPKAPTPHARGGSDRVAAGSAGHLREVPGFLACHVRNPSWVGDGYCDSEPDFDDDYDDYFTTTTMTTTTNSSTTINDDYYDDWYYDDDFEYDAYNSEACGWDGGDCCPCSCEDNDYECGYNGWDCQDPASQTCDGVCDESVCEGTDLTLYVGDGKKCEADVCTVMECCAEDKYPHCDVEYRDWIGDGICDSPGDAYYFSYDFSFDFYNSEDCGWDGGDCCPCSCEDEGGPCWEGNNWDCLDPENETCFNGICDESVCEGTDLPFFIGDGKECNARLCTAAECCAEDEYTDCYVEIRGWLGDGICDGDDYNTEECGWDGGDCCPCSCGDEEGPCYPGNGWDCLDPDHQTCDGFCDESVCEGTDLTLFIGYGKECAEAVCTVTECCAVDKYPDCHVATPVWVGDGYCDATVDEYSYSYDFSYDFYNSEDCGWDGGDCCPCSCEDGESDCGVNGWECLDPEYQSCGSTPAPTPGPNQVSNACLDPADEDFRCAAGTTVINLEGCDIWDVDYDDVMACFANAGVDVITDIDLSWNSLTALHSEGNVSRRALQGETGMFTGLSALQTLDLSGCVMTTLPSDAFQGLTRLLWLALSHNPFTSVESGAFDGLTSLETLVLYNISQSAFPAGIFDNLDGVNILMDAMAPTPSPLSGCTTDADCDRGSGEICCPEKNICEVPVNPGACGDPHMTGFRGQKFDFTGNDGGWYALLSVLDGVHLNMRVTSPVPSVPEITYITGIAIKATDHAGVDHTIVIAVTDPHNLESSCPVEIAPCLAEGALTVQLDGETALLSPGENFLGPGVAISAANLPGACRSFGFEKYWERKKEEYAKAGRKLESSTGLQDMGEWILDDPTATNMEECIEYVAASMAGGGLFAHDSEHASFQIMTPLGKIRLSHGRLHQLPMRDPTDRFDLPEHLTWQMNLAIDHHDIDPSVSRGVLGETLVPTLDDEGQPIMQGMGSIRGSEEDYRVEGPLETAFIQGSFKK